MNALAVRSSKIYRDSPGHSPVQAVLAANLTGPVGRSLGWVIGAFCAIHLKMAFTTAASGDLRLTAAACEASGPGWQLSRLIWSCFAGIR